MGSSISRQSKVSHKTMYQDIREVRVEKIRGPSNEQSYSREELETKTGGFVCLDMEKNNHGDNINDLCYYDYDKGETKKGWNITPGPNAAVFGWGHWFTFGELEKATHGFSTDNVVGEGGYGIVYKGTFPNGNAIAVKRLLDNMGQAEQEFNVEVDIIGRIRHRNLVRLLGVCTEGAHRMLVYEYVDNGNLEQWLHGALGKTSSHPFTWDSRMKIILGTAKAIAYLHEDLDPKIVHRDIKASNILVDIDWNAKVSDFGLAKLLGSQESHISTRVMGTFGYVAPEYANTGLLNERSDVYSFGVLLLETITGREPVDYSRPIGEVNLVDWLKVMVGSRRSEEVVDPTLTNAATRPTSRALKRSLLVALHCVDPDSEKRPRMGQVVRMLEADNFPFRNNDHQVSKDPKRGLVSTSPNIALQSCKENSNPMGYSPKRKDSIKKG